jgi:hypothetical protein
MAEQMIERAYSAPSLAGVPESVSPALNSQEALRQARLCLENSGRRLRRGDVEQTEEVLDLLRKATDHLRQSIAAG